MEVLSYKNTPDNKLQNSSRIYIQNLHLLLPKCTFTLKSSKVLAYTPKQDVLYTTVVINHSILQQCLQKSLLRPLNLNTFP